MSQVSTADHARPKDLAYLGMGDQDQWLYVSAHPEPDMRAFPLKNTGPSAPALLHIMQCAELGGMEQTTTLRMAVLRAQGVQNRLVSLNTIGRLRAMLDAINVPYEGLKYFRPFGLPGIPAMHRAFRALPVDAVMMTGHNLSGMIALGNLARDHRILVSVR